MPLYEFLCNDCGEFEELRSLAESSTPANCPQCGETAPKIFSAPNINLNSGSLSSIGNSGEPRLVKRKEREPAKPQYQKGASSRPWMVSH